MMPRPSINGRAPASAPHRPARSAVAHVKARPPGRFVSVEALRGWVTASRSNARLWTDANWQRRHALEAVDLARLGLLPDEAAMRAALRYPVAVTPYFLSLVDWDNPRDPIRLQWLPDGRETMRLFSDAEEDPFSEALRGPFPGLVHRFADRILLMVSTDCAIRCRHCTRKNRLDAATALPPTARAMAQVVDYIGAMPDVREWAERYRDHGLVVIGVHAPEFAFDGDTTGGPVWQRPQSLTAR